MDKTTKIELTKEERNIIAEFVYSYDADILIVSDAERVLEVLNNKKLFDKPADYESLKSGIKHKQPGICEMIIQVIYGVIPKSQGQEIMDEYMGRSNAKKEGVENKKAFYGTNVGRNLIDVREYPTLYTLRPTRIYLKENGSLNDEPSFALLMTDPNKITAPVLGELSLNMLNDGLNDVGYTIRKQSESVVIGEHIEGCNIRKLVDESPELAPNPWNVIDMRVVKLCDEKGNEMSEEEVEKKGHAETWLEFPCFGQGCKCVKRVRIKAVTQM